MMYRHLQFLPVVLCLLLLATFLITYAIAAGTGHVDPGFPYISYSGNVPPESCIFGQLLNISACLELLCVYIRYRQVTETEADKDELNFVSAIIGSLACLGLDLVANFQERSVFVVHLVGAGVCFFGGTVYFVMQTIITRRMKQQKLFYVRLLLSLICCCCCFSTVIPGGIAMFIFDGEDPMKWKPTDRGYVTHLVSAISEWVVSVSFCLFILTFYSEFKEISIESPVFRKSPPDASTTDIQL
ncbi:DNA damage-regulated autophagy modulator protein 2-like [Schistocerca serialis cubense]|uniref:DNA damage-regulated autophagy modulator protein 2-like n=1 Tax=Schistocerca serialis cubense TaxID=2023355 RepID=UPI00214F12DF|nr:DNA damage-regulated autophagy modulator protein 2-like [Schistocerca serialis cubense]